MTIELYCDEKQCIVADIREIAPGNVALKIIGLPEEPLNRLFNLRDLDKGSGKFTTKAEAEAYALQWWEDNKSRILA